MRLSNYKLLICSLLAGVLFFQGCGWHLRGKEPLPIWLNTLHLQTPSENSQFSHALKRAFSLIEVNLTDTISAAPLTLSVSNIHQNRRVQSTTEKASVAEYTLTSTITYSVKTKTDSLVVGPTPISIEKSYLYNRNNAASSYEEESLLHQQMQRDLIQQLIQHYLSLPAQ